MKRSADAGNSSSSPLQVKKVKVISESDEEETKNEPQYVDLEGSDDDFTSSIKKRNSLSNSNTDLVQKPLSFFFSNKKSSPTGNSSNASNSSRASEDKEQKQTDDWSPHKRFKLRPTDDQDDKNSNGNTEPSEPLILSKDPLVQVPASLNKKLREYQREGVQWLYNLYKENKGGILGDGIICIYFPHIN